MLFSRIIEFSDVSFSISVLTENKFSFSPELNGSISLGFWIFGACWRSSRHCGDLFWRFGVASSFINRWKCCLIFNVGTVVVQLSRSHCGAMNWSFVSRCRMQRKSLLYVNSWEKQEITTAEETDKLLWSSPSPDLSDSLGLEHQHLFCRCCGVVIIVKVILVFVEVVQFRIQWLNEQLQARQTFLDIAMSTNLVQCWCSQAYYWLWCCVTSSWCSA